MAGTIEEYVLGLSDLPVAQGSLLGYWCPTGPALPSPGVGPDVGVKAGHQNGSGLGGRL